MHIQCEASIYSMQFNFYRYRERFSIKRIFLGILIPDALMSWGMDREIYPPSATLPKQKHKHTIQFFIVVQHSSSVFDRCSTDNAMPLNRNHPRSLKIQKGSAHEFYCAMELTGDLQPGRYLYWEQSAQRSFEIVWQESQSQFLFSHFLNSEAFTGVLTKSETKWEASVTNVSTSESKRWYLHPCADGLLVERSDGFQCRAERMMLSKEWQSVVEQPVAAGETLLIKAAPGSGKSTLLREWCRGRPDNNILLVAFNKAVSEQLDVNFRRGVLFVEFWFDVHFSFFFFWDYQRWNKRQETKKERERNEGKEREGQGHKQWSMEDSEHGRKKQT